MRITAACLLLGLAACTATDPKAFVPTAKQNDAVNQYALCLWNAANASDDHVSDAATIGLAILPMCAAAYQRANDALTQGMSLQENVMFLRKQDADRLALATAAVVKSRQQQP